MASLFIDQENTTGGMSLWQMVTPGPLTWTIKTVSSRFMTAMIPIPTESQISQMVQPPTPFPPVLGLHPITMTTPRATLRPTRLTPTPPPFTTPREADSLTFWVTILALPEPSPLFPSTKAGPVPTPTTPPPLRFSDPTTTPPGLPYKPSPPSPLALIH